MHQPTTKPVRSAQADTTHADLTVVAGAGHVGIPLVLAFTEAGEPGHDNKINFTGIRAGEWLHEILFTRDEETTGIPR